MAYRITDGCISCGHCCVVCPQNAIDDGYRKPHGENWLYSGFRITDTCAQCGRCVEVCPVGAIVKE